MDLTAENSVVNMKSGNIYYHKISLTKKSRITIVLRMILISFCCIFFPLEAILDSGLAKMEIEY